MSESEQHEHESKLCDGGNGTKDVDEDDKEREDEEGDGNGEVQKKEASEISRDFKKSIKRPFRKRKKEKERGDSEVVKSPSVRRRRRRIQFGGGRVGGGSCYVCFLQPKREESPETPTSDPNSETFSFEMLSTLIEKNDFYCKECNPHI